MRKEFEMLFVAKWALVLILVPTICEVLYTGLDMLRGLR